MILKNKLSQLNRLKEKVPNWFIDLFSISATIFLSYFILEYVSGFEIFGVGDYLKQIVFKNVLISILTVGLCWAFFFIVCNRVWLANLLCSIFCGGLAIANHYVIMLHGMPLSFLVLRNFKTAMNVISGYQFTIDIHVIRVLLLLCFTVVVALLPRFFATYRKRTTKYLIIRNTALILVCVLFFSVTYLGSNPLKPKKTIAWNWAEAYHKYGYPACTIETLFQAISVVNMPDGYTEDALNQIEINHRPVENPATPDVILILNESFYDLRQINDIETDKPFMENIESMPTLLKGHAIVPGTGGGTNLAEYELLTSNSLQLMPGVTPFNTIRLNGANSITSHMNSLGYYTVGSHPEPSINYSRIYAYHDLQFQEIHFEEDFTDVETYETRRFKTDKSVYSNMIRWYEAAPADSPRFMYLLTIQNHGGYDLNAPEADLIHVKTDLGNHTALANEFLSCISLTDQSFKELTEYFAQVDRPVIICMVGDHAPDFTKSIISDKLSGAEADLKHRTVPLLVWANYDLGDIELGTMSMNYVVPTLLDIANVQLSPYYSYILQVKEQVPILSAYGSYYDNDGTLFKYDTDTGMPYESLVDNYFFLEYENLQTERNQNLFQPYS